MKSVLLAVLLLSFGGLCVCNRMINVHVGETEKKKVWTERILEVSSKEVVRLLFLFARMRITSLLNLSLKKINCKT